MQITKLTAIITMLFLINATLAIAYDLSDYPELFRQDGKINITAVVGDKSAAPNVIALTEISFSLKQRSDIFIQNKIASEISNTKQNIISVGNPCINKVTALLMSNPEPCNKDFPKGKAFIKLTDNGEYRHMIVAGYSDAGTRKAADVLANYKDYSLKGNEFAIDIENDQAAAANVGEQAIAVKKEAEKDFKKPINETVVAQINGSIALNESYTLNTNITLRVDTELENNPQKGLEKQGQQINNKTEEVKEEKGNFIIRFFRRLIVFFKQK